jgi:uncharacterized protein DUF1549/uncharacterized protein DUF1553
VSFDGRSMKKMVLGAALAGLLAGGRLAGETPAPVAARIEVFPASLSLEGPEDARRVLVTGISASGERFDLTKEAIFEVPADLIRLDAEGYFSPLKDGGSSIKVRAGGLEAALPVAVKDFDKRAPVSFVRDVEPILNKAGCTAGTCHGAAKGKNGFRLSLRGYDPEFDHMSLVDDLSGRRFNRADPAQSLMLLKPTQGVPHQGGFLFDAGSRFYNTLHQWIAEGVPSDAGKTPRVARLELVPGDVVLQDAGAAQQLLVVARYAEGTTRDVTRDSFFTSSVFTVAEVTPSGRVTALRRGETAVIVRYEGQFATANVTVLGDRSGFAWQEVPENNYIDRLIHKKLKKIQALPSSLASDDIFLRRAHLDLTGVPPSPEEVRAFLAEGEGHAGEAEVKERRARLIERLLERPEHIDHWALKWSDLLQANRKYLGDKGVWAFRNWIREAVARNMPFDQFARTLLTGKGGTYTSPESSYFRVHRQPEVAMETTTQLFLGVRFMCNKCHDHPFEQWTQKQYYELSAYFAKTAIKAGGRPGEEIVYDRPDGGGEVKHPKTGRAVLASFPFQYGVEIPKLESPREELSLWLTDAKNPYFAKAVVNRVWSYFFGRGIIDPVDDIRASNPPSNPELLDALVKDFIDHGFDLKHLIRTIVSSRAYQLTVETNQWNSDDSINFSHQSPRRLNAEQLLDAIVVASGVGLRFDGVPAGFRAAELPDSKVNEGGFLDLFGRPPRESPCECERRSEVSLSQALNLVNGPTIADAVADPTGRITRGIAAGRSDREIIEEIYLASLSRFPGPSDFQLAEDYLAGPGARQEKIQDLLWALINSPAFLFNR